MKELSILGTSLRFVVCGAVMSTLFFADAVYARVNTVTGGLTLGTEYLDQNGAQSSDEDDYYSRMRLTPTVDFTTASEKDELHFTFSPSLLYDYDTHETDMQYAGGVDGFKMFSERWTVGFADTFVYSDSSEYDPNDDSASGVDPVADDDERRTYWTNDFLVYSEYVYAERSSYRLTYNYTKLENDVGDTSSNYENYDKHEFRINNEHSFNSFWSLSSSFAYIIGLYEPTSDTSTSDDSDINEYRFSTGLTTTKIDHHALTLYYSYIGTVYADDADGDSALHSLALQWQWDYSSVLAFNASAGGTYERTDGFSGRWGRNGSLGFDYTFEKGSLSFSAEQRYDSENFSGSTDENGLTKTEEALLNWNYNLFEYTSLGAYLRYVNERQEENTLERETYDTKTWSTGASVTQQLSEDYSVRLSYNYTDQESERAGDTYIKHYFNLSLSYNSELFKW